MLIQTWAQVFSSSLQNLWLGLVGFVPSLIVALIIFIVGWVVGSILGKAIAQGIRGLKLDAMLASTGIDALLARAGLKLDVGGFIGWIVKWFFIIVFLLPSLELLHLTQVNDFLKEVVLNYLPNVVIAAFILVIAAIVSETMSKVVASSAKAANVHTANFLATLTRYAILIFAFIIALSQLGIAAAFMQILFTGLVAMLAIAGGLAFGLGGKDAAARTIEKIQMETTHGKQ